MSKNIWIVVAIAVLSLGGWYAYQSTSTGANQAASEQQTTTVSYQGEDGKSALEILKATATVETTTDPNLGEFVTSVNGVASGTSGKYWIYYVNGQPATVGAADYSTESSDTIEWKLE